MAERRDDGETDPALSGRTVVGPPGPGAPLAKARGTLVQFDSQGVDDTMPAPGASARTVRPGSAPTVPGSEGGSSPTVPGSVPPSGSGSSPTVPGSVPPSGSGSSPTVPGSLPPSGSGSSATVPGSLPGSSSSGTVPGSIGGAPASAEHLSTPDLQASPPGYSSPSGSHPRQILPGGRVGSFVVERHLGAGAMGIVLLARDLELGRPVAIKLLSAGDDPDAAQRLLREAQATARLSHSNVVAVHQVGTWEGQGFIVMEYVDGGTLRQWLQARKASWRDVLGAYRQAGQGLAAAHMAGLVHRDFKPDNCLVGRDGRVRVSDFGLVGLSDTAMTPAALSSTHDSSLDGDPLLTRTGAMLGTPAYMAPEQFQGSRVDARADQFAFCVALYEALYGHRPFEGDTAASLLYAILQGQVRPPPRSDVPAEIHRAILKGLAADPSARHESMAPLLRVLAPKQGAPVAAIAGVSAAVVVLGGGATLFVLAPWQSDPAAPSAAGDAEEVFQCPDPTQQIAEVWNDERRGKLSAAFVSTGVASAQPMLDSSLAVLDDFTAEWISVQQAACTAMDEGETTRADLDRQLHCLEARRTELSSMLSVLEEGDSLVIQGALGAVARLRPSRSCADADELRLGAQLPEDEDARARIIAARDKLVRGRLLYAGTKYPEARTLADELVEELRSLDYPPDLARALLLAGEVRSMQMDQAGAEPFFREAIELAASSKAHDVEVEAWPTNLANLLSLGKVGEARTLLAPAQAAAARASDAQQSARIDMIASQVYFAQGDLAGGLERVSAAIAGFEAGSQTPSYVELGLAYSTRAGIFMQQQRLDEARRDYEQALAHLDRGIGPRHSHRTSALLGIAQLDHLEGKFDDAIAKYKEAIDVLRANHGDIDQIAQFLTRWGVAEQGAGRRGRARGRFEEAVEHAERTGGPNSQYVVEPLSQLALLDYQDGEFERALARYGRSGAIYGALAGTSHPQVAWYDLQRAATMMAMGDDENAVEVLSTVTVRFKAAEGRESMHVADARLNLAEAYQRLGRCDDALQEIAEVRHIRKFLQAGDDIAALHLSVGAALCHVAQGDVSAAGPELAEAKRLRPMLTDPAAGAYVDYAAAHVAMAQGDEEGAGALMRGSIEAHRKLGPSYGRMVDLGNAWLAKDHAAAPSEP